MIRVFICPECGKTRLVSKLLRADCRRCGAAMRPCDIPYSKWVELSEEEREAVSGRLTHLKEEEQTGRDTGRSEGGASYRPGG